MMTRTRKSPDRYKVGYGKPPVHHRFRPGQSGNPHGRPRKARNLDSVVVQAMARPTGRGRHRKTNFETVVAELVDNAIAGHVPSLVKVLQFMQSYDTLEEPSPPPADDDVFDFRKHILESHTEFPDF